MNDHDQKNMKVKTLWYGQGIYTLGNFISPFNDLQPNYTFNL
jgi:hypothetical protein